MIRNNKTFKAWMAVAIVVAILLIDQIIKIEVKTNMTLGEAKRVTDWFYIEFIENNGMAYGMKFINKLVLSLFRLFAIGFIGYYLAKIIKKNVAPLGYIVLIAMVLAGAAGNLIDCLFYGLIFDASTPFTVSQFVPFGEGYSTFRLFRQHGLSGFRISEALNMCSSLLSSTSLTHVSASELWLCCCSTENSWKFCSLTNNNHNAKSYILRHSNRVCIGHRKL